MLQHYSGNLDCRSNTPNVKNHNFKFMKKSCVKLTNGLLVASTFLIFVFAISTQVMASNTSQQTKFSFNHRGTVGEVIQLIEGQSNYRFFYQKSQLNLNRQVDLKVKNENINSVLAKLFYKDGIAYRILENNLIVISREGDGKRVERVVPQHNEKIKARITGKVTDVSGAPIQGVTVAIKGTHQGTITDPNGNYILTNVAQSEVLVFSFVGMVTQQIQVSDKNLIDVVLKEDTKGIDEVVVVGYGNQKKVSLVGAQTNIKNMDELKQPVANLSTILAGRLSGVVAVQSNGEPGNDNANIWIGGYQHFLIKIAVHWFWLMV